MQLSPEPPDPVELLAELIRAPSVTPDAGPAFDVLERHLIAAGFSVERPVFEEPGAASVENLFAVIGRGSTHACFAGHADVVPPGPEANWTHPPFAGEVKEGFLYGRGAVDMKGGLAAMAAAACRFAATRGADFGGRLSLLVTGDEEGPAINGTQKLLAWAAARGERFSVAIVGEPTSAEVLGDQIKIGRRGSYSATLAVDGVQGHAAYPHKAENPIRGLTQLLQALMASPLDTGSAHFEASTLEVVNLEVGNTAWNVIPGHASARLNSRFNDRWNRTTLRAEIERRLTAASEAGGLGVRTPIRWTLAEETSGSDVFLTRDDDLIGALSAAIRGVTGREPALSTAGGTSDARFIKDYCPVVEFGPVGATMHAVDECVSLSDLEATTRIYQAFLDACFPR